MQKRDDYNLAMLKIDCLEGSSVHQILQKMDEVYTQIDESQTEWKKVSPMQCPDGCGCCCENFEPDVLESEALYMAAFLVFNEPQKAQAILDGSYISPRKNCGNTGKGCFLFNPADNYHCTVYNGRPFICRLFGYSGDTDKDGKPRWKPCRFVPEEKLFDGIEHRQYTAAEIEERWGVLPPVMSVFLTQIIALEPDGTDLTRPLHEALPDAIAKIKMLLQFLAPNNPEPNSPQPTVA